MRSLGGSSSEGPHLKAMTSDTLLALLPALVPYGIAIALVSGLVLSIVLRRPPRVLWPALLSYQLFALLYLVGNAITRFSTVSWVEQLGIALLYSGAFGAAAACWVLTLRYAEAQGRPFPWARGAWVRGPMLGCGVAWAVMVSNPWHGQFVTPVIGAHNDHHWAWWLFVPIGYGLVVASLALQGLLAASTRDRVVRRNALLMAGGMLTTLVFNALSFVPSLPLPFDPTVVGLGGASAIFLYGAYRTQLFSLLPVAVLEATRHDPSARILVDLEGGWLRSNAAAGKLLGPSLRQPGRDVVSLLARLLRDAEGEAIARDELARRLLQGPRARHELVGPLRAGDGHWIELTATPIPRCEGRARAVALRIQDVSDRMAVEEQLRRARNELRNEARERHRVDTLLGDILRDVGRASAALDDPRCLRDLLRRIRRAAEQARELSGVVVPKP